MPDETNQSISFIFRTPKADSTGYHERTIEGVPKTEVLKMAKDFEEYGGPGSGVSPHRLYRFEKEGEERLVALDFSEVSSIIV